MAYTNSTQYYNLPQYAENDIPSWDDLTTAFAVIDNALHSIASASGITEQQAQTLINNAMVGVVKHDATSGTGITNSQYSKLTIVS